MPLYGSDALKRIREGQLTLGLGVHHLRGSAVPLLARAAGYDWLFIDAEHGAISTPEIAQISMAALPMGIAPIVRANVIVSSSRDSAGTTFHASPRRSASAASTHGSVNSQ